MTDTRSIPYEEQGVKGADLNEGSNIVTAQQSGAEDPAPAVDVAIPALVEKRWLVIVAQVGDQHDPETGEGYQIVSPLWVLSPKGGGPASLLDEKTWGDWSMAVQRRNMVRDKLRKERGSYGRTAYVGFVHEDRLHWSDSVPAEGKREVR